MSFFIKIKDGFPTGHPYFEENVRDALSHLDWDNVPEGWARFKTVEQPQVGTFQVLNPCAFEQIDGVWQHVWSVREMTLDEKAVRVNQEHDAVRIKVQYVYAEVEKKRHTATAEEHEKLDILVARLNVFTYDDPFTAKVPADTVILPPAVT